MLGSADGSVFDRSVVDELLQGQDRGYANTQRLFAVAMFELWRSAYTITV